MTTRILLSFLLFSAAAGCGDDDRPATDAGPTGDASEMDAAPGCPTPTTMCGADCVDTQSDPAHCGGCDMACAAGEACVDGACGVVCPSGQTLCDGACIDTMTDRRHCGACGTACAEGEICAGGACEISCPAGQVVCGTACVDTQSNPANCGACGTVCAAGEVCDMGACAVACSTGLMECSGACVNTTSNPSNCGACGTTCATTAADASGLCIGGSCRTVCNELYGDCNADLAAATTDGCETPLATDPANCGACNRRCSLANAIPGCSMGACVVATCAAGFGNCDADDSNGCESLTYSDDMNCGACGNVCASGQRCIAGSCAPIGGESCADAIALAAGANTVAWTATMADYFTTEPSCSTAGSLDGPDVVMSYTATRDETVTLVIDKPADTRWHAIVSTAACGTMTELACMSEDDDPALSGTFSLTTGQTAYIYLRDTTTGDFELRNPLDVTVAAVDCATDPPPAVLEVSPANGATVPVESVFRVQFGGVVSTTTGTVTITGDMGTSLSYDLSTSPAEVDFYGSDTVMEIDPGMTFPQGESLTLALTGMVSGVCTGGGTITSPTWAVTVTTPSCTPGMGGMVGTTLTRVVGPTVGTEYYLAADENPSGWVYIGGTSELQRVPKSGGAAEDIEALAGLTSSHLGYNMIVSGNHIYTVESETSATTGHVFRISTDGGTTWSVEDYAMFPTSPNDDFLGSAVYEGRIYLVTEDFAVTEIWSMPANAATAPVTARLEASIPGVEGCSALARDSSFYYLACSTNDRLWRLPTYGSDPVVLDDGTFDISGTTNSLFGADLDGNGIHDVLYLQTSYEEAYYVCDPATTAPHPAMLVNFGASVYGMGFDRAANTLWMFDDEAEEFVSIQ